MAILHAGGLPVMLEIFTELLDDSGELESQIEMDRIRMNKCSADGWMDGWMDG